MSNTTKFTGDDWEFIVTLKQNGLPLDVSGATSIKIQVVYKNSRTPSILIPSITASSGYPGADWANGIVGFSFSGSTTSSVLIDSALLEIQKDENSKKTTWPRISFDIAVGTISTYI
tara:strand:+ start:1196 stop:1546 length:351 start_codon:yes stop_codon:yes gene_type:complete